MKRIVLLLLLCRLTSFSMAQAQYEISPDPQHPEQKVLKGILNKYLLQNDTGYKWYANNHKFYKADTAILTALEKHKASVSYIVFGGTWCEDTQFILPQFFSLLEKAGVPDEAVSLYGVTRDKKTLGNLAAALKITNVPTVIVMMGGKELGRVVEYGKTGRWDREIADILVAGAK